MCVGCACWSTDLTQFWYTCIYILPISVLQLLARLGLVYSQQMWPECLWCLQYSQCTVERGCDLSWQHIVMHIILILAVFVSWWCTSQPGPSKYTWLFMIILKILKCVTKSGQAEQAPTIIMYLSFHLNVHVCLHIKLFLICFPHHTFIFMTRESNSLGSKI